MRAEHINITIPTGLKVRIDEESRRERIGRSTLIQKAVAFYLELIKRKRLKSLLVEGYAEMSGESLKIMKDFEDIDKESMKYVN
jgi:metal-responsive CopG/Arc/MetJ family transcriptional regulator